MIASLAGIAGYFHLVPGGYDLLTLYDRARGYLQDPNVLGAFLILPALFALQSVVSDQFGEGVPQRRRASASSRWRSCCRSPAPPGAA